MVEGFNFLDVYDFLNTKSFHELARNMKIFNCEFFKEGELMRFRGWDSNLPLPEEFVVKNEIIGYGLSRKNQKIIKRTLWGKVEKLNKFKKRWKNGKKPKYWGNQRSRPFYIKDGWIWVRMHNNWGFGIENLGSKDFSYKNGWLYYEIPLNYIGISYISGDKHGCFVLIPNKMGVDDFFLEGLGLQQGDGTQSSGDVHITFTNGCIDLILHQIKWFEILGMSKKAIRFYPEIPKSYELDYKKMKYVLMENGIDEIQFRKGKSKLSNTRSVLFQIVFHNKLFKLFYLYLLNGIRPLIFKKYDLIIPYLKGIIAAEGCIKLDSRLGIPSTIKISATCAKRREFIRNCLSNIGVVSSNDDLTKGSEAVIINNSKNFSKLNKLKILDLHPDKLEKFNNAISKYQRLKI